MARFFMKKNIKKLTGIVGMLLVILFLSLPWKVNADTVVKLVLNNQNLNPEVPPQIINGRAMVPLRCIAEAFGADITWEETSRTVYINTKKDGSDSGQKVPVRPNASIVNGKVSGYSVQDPSLFGMQGTDPLYLLDIQIESTEDIPGELNFMQSKIGLIIKAYSSTKLPADVYGQRISARITYHGDERGGKYWLSDASFK